MTLGRRIAEELKNYREKSRKSQEVLAKEVGVSRATLNRWERHGAGAATANEIERIFAITRPGFDLLSAVTPSITPEAALDVISEELNRLRVELAAARATSPLKEMAPQLKGAPPAPVIPPEVAAALARLPAQSPRWIAVRAALGLEPGQAGDSAAPAPPKAKK
jgi:transcriptional regulator with XRE-family HTH domain